MDAIYVLFGLFGIRYYLFKALTVCWFLCLFVVCSLAGWVLTENLEPCSGVALARFAFE